MATIIEMPKLSDTMTEGTVVRWAKNEGDKVASGDVLAEIETDKATMELPAFDDGILGKIYVPAGGRAPLGAALAAIVAEGEEAPAAPPAAAPAGSAGGTDRKQDGSPERKSRGARPDRSGSGRISAGGRIKSSPLARKIAAERGVDLRNLEGTGPGGRIVSADVLNAPAGGTGGGRAVQTIRPVAGPDDTRVPVSSMRAIIADRLLASKTQIPHFYLNIEVDAGPILRLRRTVNEGAEASGGNKYTVNDFILKAVASAVAEVPEVNASFDGDTIVRFAGVHLAVAIAIDDGLLTPVIRDAQNRSLLELSTAVKDLAARAKSRKLTPDELSGGTITVSNLGAYGIDRFDAIINPPQAAIISVGAAKRVPVVSESGEIVPGDRMNIGMSCDHRVVDGAVGATCLAALKKLLENPALMLV